MVKPSRSTTSYNPAHRRHAVRWYQPPPKCHAVGRNRKATRTARPGDRYNSEADWQDILEPHDWRIQSTRGDTTYWTKPFSRRGEVHATTNYRGVDVLKVFSSDAPPFETNQTYNKFAAYALLNHKGDFRKAARAIALDYNPNLLETNDQREEEDNQ